jgi:putative phosphoribosyl transferase
MTQNRFTDRRTAGRQLAERLATMRLAPPIVVLALPRGGVPVAAEIAQRLHAPLDLLMVRKIGVPWQPELALAAVVDGAHPSLVYDDEVRHYAKVPPGYVEQAMVEALREIERRRRIYLAGRETISVRGCTAIVVDDGIATGTSMRAALRALRDRAPARLVLAVPVAPEDTIAQLRAEVDEVVCLATPSPFHAVGLHYVDFHQVEDAEVIAALRGAAPGSPDSPR